MKKIISTLLLGMMLLTACGPAETPDTTDTTAAPSDQTGTTAPSETTSLASTYGIVPADFGGEEICIISGEHAKYEYEVEEISGDTVNDAIYERNLKVEDLLKVKFTYVNEYNWQKKGEFYTLIRNDVQAGDCTYDIINGLNIYTTPLIFEGMFRRLDNVPTINLDNPWWVPGPALDGSDKVYYAFSDASLSLYKDLYVLFFNQRLIEESQMESPYTLVENGKWTLDNFLTLAYQGSRDLNGDTVIDIENDQIAYHGKHATSRGFATATGISFLDKVGDTVQLKPLPEFAYDVHAKLTPFMSNKEYAIIENGTQNYGELAATFTEGRILFHANCLGAVESMRDMIDNYGIVPLPKYNEAQQNYRSQIATSTSAIYMHVNAPVPEMLGTVLEALGFYSMTEVVPVYYENALYYKYARDKQVQAMLATVRDSASTNYDFAYGSIFGSYNFINLVRDNKDLASYWASLETKTRTNLEKYLAIELPD